MRKPSTADSAHPVSSHSEVADANSTIVFLCPYGGAKSVIAALSFNRMAEGHALPFTALARAAEEPYDAVPPPVVGFLADEGFDVSTLKPRRVARETLAEAARIISIDCDLQAPEFTGLAIERWDDVPK